VVIRLVSSSESTSEVAPIESSSWESVFAPMIGAVMNGCSSIQAKVTRLAVVLWFWAS
jgi:hypothetical protein